MTLYRKHFTVVLLIVSSIFLSPGRMMAQTPVINGEQAEPPVQEPRQEPKIHIDAAWLDFGIISSGQKGYRRIAITNIGKDVLKWRAATAKEKDQTVLIGRFISLVNDEIRNSGLYRIPTVYRDACELSGSWLESNGYPVFMTRSVLKYHFSGTGLRIYFWKDLDAGKFSVYIDQNFIMEVDVQAEARERADVLIAENLPFGQHTLTITGKEGKATLEGLEVYGRPVVKGPPGWITLLPSSGVTTREIDYVSIVLNTQRMTPGLYGDVVSLSSNGDDVDIPVSVEVVGDASHKTIDVYRYASGSDYLLSSNPSADEQFILSRRYIKEGIAFRLFPPGTPGTVEFYRWYNPSRKSHFYSHNRNDAGKIEREYVFDGTIGNIATIKLRGVRELYRWFNPRTGFYFYSTDVGGDGMQKKGYRFDGIAGYVR